MRRESLVSGIQKIYTLLGEFSTKTYPQSCFYQKLRHGQLAQPTGLFIKQNRLDNDAVM